MTQLLWTQKQDIGPSARFDFDMVFDPARRRVVLFGGAISMTPGNNLVNDTWEWNGSEWTQTADIGPSPRMGHALAYDSQRQRVVLFGGTGTTYLGLGDTWEWDGESWTQVADTGPSARTHHAITFDSRRNRVILFWGVGADQIALADTWVWDGNEWAQEQDSGPKGRFGHKLVYDSGRNRVVLLGGNNRIVTSEVVQDRGFWGNVVGTHTETRITENQLGDTWEYDGSLWAHVADTGPEPRSGYGMIFDGEKTLLFGGSKSGQSFGSTWSWDGRFWTQRQDMGPGGRWAFGMAFDSVRQRSVLFGGNINGRLLADTWELFHRPNLTANTE